MRHCVGAAQLPTADAVAESAECGMKIQQFPQGNEPSLHNKTRELV
jgi:hypothetical protein